MCSSAFCATTKLSCHVDVTTTLPSGNTEKNSGNIVVQIDTNNGVTYISGTGARLDIAVSSQKLAAVIEATDLSDDGKWDLSNTSTRKDGSEVETQLVIDRNTGDLYYQRMGKSIQVEAAGMCKKVDLRTRKF